MVCLDYCRFICEWEGDEVEVDQVKGFDWVYNKMGVGFYFGWACEGVGPRGVGNGKAGMGDVLCLDLV